MPATPVPVAGGTQRTAADPLNAAISETLRTLARTVRSFQLYLPNNPMHVRAIDAARAGFVAWHAKQPAPLFRVASVGQVSDQPPSPRATARPSEPWPSPDACSRLVS